MTVYKSGINYRHWKSEFCKYVGKAHDRHRFPL